MSAQVIPVMEQFCTIQGEGAHTGKPAYFIRLGGCDVGCVWCDVKESWDAENHPPLSTQEIINKMHTPACAIVVVTGGEPLMYDLNELTGLLKKAGYSTHLETSGAYSLSGEWDWICVSPKKFKEVLPEVLEKADELKVVVYHESDLEWAEQFRPRLKEGCKLFLQPEWSKAEKITPVLINYVQANPHWRISLQTHKYMDIP